MFHMSRRIFIICMHIPGITLTSSRTPPHDRDYPRPLKICSNALRTGIDVGQAGSKPAQITVISRATAASDDAAVAASNACKQ